MRSRLAKVFAASLQEFYLCHGFTKAAALSFYALVAFIPLVFLAVSAAGVIAGKAEAARSFIAEQLELMLPWYKDLVMSRLTDMAKVAAGLGLHSVVFMFWTSGLFFFELRQSLRADWPTRPVSPVERWYGYLFPWLAGPGFSIVLLLLMAAVQVVGYLPRELAAWIAAANPLVSPLAVSAVSLAVMFFLLYVFILPATGRLRPMLAVAAFLSLASHVITLVISRVLTGLPNYNVFYGSLSGTILFLFWLEWNMSLLLAGGHFLRLWPGGGDPAPACAVEAEPGGSLRTSSRPTRETGR